MKSLTLWLIKLYQKFLTLFSYGSCRYYPTCSQYAKEQLLYNNFFKALWYSVIRILKCNQLFVGGIDYPIVRKVFAAPSFVHVKRISSQRVVYWFVPKGTQSFYIVKAFKTLK
ncbi:MAG: membrane protein insertion efficiency factor YidD [Epsilonproteobacteria bacterium]|uniref:Putative membrane protein insertion efficiency factor n=1 Tax=Sulfurospirillum cavolei TaxID=366522 RepID=A0A2D3WJP0_9BACT|nr:membrane protein insertion efficiency factor YidD [Sulfurospirillum sp. DNRA8]MCD8544961.1 membrane protein insertion efficiency factor YidD [Sulfurospirillum cavolei]NCB54157.1 membrane protein insertion efficiency factor YidD [Campylobacterota bacterium]MCP3650978.1 membrane protein insertion efficiency factor YidD [Sulfurospirillum sp. DNRA8]MCR1809824.1 membrane protein insertion efficiency factor YidD [Sulfurospirillum sp. DNRA8]MDY0265273.1 membrane protein insertion efficiency factor